MLHTRLDDQVPAHIGRGDRSGQRGAEAALAEPNAGPEARWQATGSESAPEQQARRIQTAATELQSERLADGQ